MALTCVTIVSVFVLRYKEKAELVAKKRFLIKDNESIYVKNLSEVTLKEVGND